MRHLFLTTAVLLGISVTHSFSQDFMTLKRALTPFNDNPRDPINEVVRPKEIDDVLYNPGMGFMTFQRFNGDDNNPGSGWTEGFPIEYQPFDGNLNNVDHPATTIAYWRVYWYFFEPEMGNFRWDMLDKALETARLRGQTLILRIAPYGDIAKDSYNTDVPEWYRKMVGSKKDFIWKNWAVDPEDPRYHEYFGRMIKALGNRYDGHPDLEAVDISIVGPWGEGAGSEFLKPATMHALVDAYTQNFRKTPLIALLMDYETNTYAKSTIPVGWRVDCIGDLRIWGGNKDHNWSHMTDKYPTEIISHKLQEDWKYAPISFEICGTFLNWKESQKMTREEVKWTFDEALKWHISSFNAKSSPVPEEWKDLVDDWQKKMGYRFVLKRLVYPKEISANVKFPFYSLWENKGVAPCYKDYAMAVRIKSENNEKVFVTDIPVKEWLPGQFVNNDSFFIPSDFPSGIYDVQVAIVDRQMHLPRVNLAIEGKLPDGWYQLGKVKISK